MTHRGWPARGVNPEKLQRIRRAAGTALIFAGVAVIVAVIVAVAYISAGLLMTAERPAGPQESTP